jgi:hypothetical protein
MAIPVALIGPLIAAGTQLLDRLIPDKAAAEKAKVEMEASLLAAANQVNLAQIDVNKAEAQHRSVWVAGWRPGIGWVCTAGLAWAFIGQPVAEWVLTLRGIEVALPQLYLDYLMELVLAMLGMAGLRTFEKMRGVTS